MAFVVKRSALQLNVDFGGALSAYPITKLPSQNDPAAVGVSLGEAVHKILSKYQGSCHATTQGPV